MLSRLYPNFVTKGYLKIQKRGLHVKKIAENLKKIQNIHSKPKKKQNVSSGTKTLEAYRICRYFSEKNGSKIRNPDGKLIKKFKRKMGPA